MVAKPRRVAALRGFCFCGPAPPTLGSQHEGTGTAYLKAALFMELRIGAYMAVARSALAGRPPLAPLRRAASALLVLRTRPRAAATAPLAISTGMRWAIMPGMLTAAMSLAPNTSPSPSWSHVSLYQSATWQIFQGWHLCRMDAQRQSIAVCQLQRPDTRNVPDGYRVRFRQRLTSTRQRLRIVIWRNFLAAMITPPLAIQL
jgi:hypothetical protein